MAKYYLQNAAALALTISSPMEIFSKSIEIEPGFWCYYPEVSVYLATDHQTHNFFEIDSLRPMVQAELDFIQKKPGFSKRRIADIISKAKNLEEKGEQLLLSAREFSPTHIAAAKRAFLEFNLVSRDFWSTSFFLDALDPFEQEITEFIFGEKKDEISREDLQVLMTPTHSIFREEQLELDAIRQSAGTDSKKADSLLNAHAQKYWWIQNDYQTVKRLSGADFLERLKEPEYDDSLQKIENEKKRLMKKYSLSAETNRKLNEIMELAYLRDLRKKFTQIGNFYSIRFFYEIAKKNGVSIEQANFMIPYLEYEKFMQKDPVLLEELVLRTREGVWYHVRASKGNAFCEIQTKGAKKRYDETESKCTGNALVYGSPASLGIAIGPAKIVLRQPDFGKFNEGDILITGMTRPEFVPLMKKAIAIVTDEGGITSHAAIISRELGKPCVIGTQVATKTFKDGEIVEVNANHGFVRKLEETK